MKFLLAFCLAIILASPAEASTDYGPAIWRPVYPGHWYTSGYGHKFVVIHDIEGYYLSTISYFQRSSTQASIHYYVNGKKDYASDANPGEVSQGVREAYYAWHARCWNQHSLGTEHEGFVSNPAWYTEAMYQASSALQRHLCNKFGIPKNRNYVVGHDQKRISGWPSFASSTLGVSGTCNDHTDPGPYWNWTHFMNLINQTASTPSGPSALTVTVASSSQLNLKWTDHSGIETGFKVERATASGGPWTQIGTTAANDVTYSATGLASGTRYYFRVRAYNAAGNSPYSNVANGTTKDVIPGAPSALVATAVSQDQINLTWTQGSGNEDGFKIERGTAAAGPFTQIATVGINVTSYSSVGLVGNTRYYYRVRSYNTAGNSAYSNVANDLTAPQMPTALTATAAAYNQINLSWTDNASSEAGFKIERGTAAAGPFTQIATNAASDTTYSNTGLAGTTTYYYRVRSYNANGNSDYTPVVSATTPNTPPTLGAIGDKTVVATSNLTFTATASDPNQTVTTTTWQTFESFTNNTPNEQVMFNRPSNSASTSAFQDTSTNYTFVTQTFPTGHSGSKVMKVGWGFKTGQVNPWVRLNTYNPPQVMNPTVAGDQILRFDIYSTKALKVGLGLRETGTAAAYGANGGTTGTIDWAGVTNVVSSAPLSAKQIAANTWTTLTFNVPFESQRGFTGDGVVNLAKVVLEHLALGAVNNASGAYTVYLDNFAVVSQNTLNYTLEAGAPAGATINKKTGKFSWTPTAGQEGTFDIGVRVTDQLGAIDNEIITVTVTGVGNSAPVLAAIGAKTVNEGSALTFTAAATDVNAGQTKTFSLDAGAPAGASINATSGAFTWTPTEANGPGTFPITVRVTDNGAPAKDDFETVTVTVKEVNLAPVAGAISDVTLNEGGVVAFTATATDADAPANTLTYSLDPGAPAGASINPTSGAFTWTTTEAQGPNTYPITVRVKDNGTPSLYALKTFNVTVDEINTAPVLSTVSSVTTVTNIADFEGYEDDTYNGTILFRQPAFSSTTIGFLDAAVTNFTTVTASFPEPDINISSRVLHASWSFLTGTSNPWMRLSTYNSVVQPNPTINLQQRLRFDVYSDKAVKVGLGVRETGTSAQLGANGGNTGTIEYVGVSGLTGSAPNPTRTIGAGVWTTVEIDIPNEPAAAFTGDGVVSSATGKGTLEHLSFVPSGGSGVYNVYLDNISVVNVTTDLIVDTGTTLTITNSAVDADGPAQGLIYSLDAGAPAGAEIDPETGVFTWTPSAGQGPSTNTITIRVTDDGPGALSDSKTIIVIVNKVNISPNLTGFPDQGLEVAGGSNIELTAEAFDEDGDTLTFSLQGSVPSGAAIDPVTGVFTWTPPNMLSTNVVTIRVTDNGTPALFDERDLILFVTPTNATPVLTLSTSSLTETVVTYETFTNNTPNELVMFNRPSNSGTTSGFLDTSTNYTSVTTTFPAGHASAKVLKIGFGFAAGTTNPWLRLNSQNTAILPNPIIGFTSKLQFDVYTTKALKVGLGVRETSSSGAYGGNGGTTGTLEWVGVPSKNGTAPNPSRTVNASTWTTLTFDLTTDSVISALGSGDGVLNSTTGKGVLEHLALVPAGGSGAYTVYLDNFKVISAPALGSTVTVNVGSTLTFAASATDADVPAQVLEFGLDADAPTNATINMVSGAFSWTPTSANIGTNPIEVFVNDNPTNGATPETDSQVVTVVVVADPIAAQRPAPVVPAPDPAPSMKVAAKTIDLKWAAAPGSIYRIQYKNDLSDPEWTDLWPDVLADSDTGSITLPKEGDSRFYRVVLKTE